MSTAKEKKQDDHHHHHDHVHGTGCSHDHHKEPDEKETEKNEPQIPPKEVIQSKIKSVQQTIIEIDNGLETMQKGTAQNIPLIEKEFNDLLTKLALRRDTLTKQLNEITLDKKEILTKQKNELKEYEEALKREINKDDIDISIAERDISLRTKADILVNISNDKLSDSISKMGDINNYFAPNPPRIVIEDVKAHTCKVSFFSGDNKYDGFQVATKHLVEIAFAPKKKGNDDEKEIYSKLKWKKIAEKENTRFIKIKKLKPATVYYVRVSCANDYGWSDYCDPNKLETIVLKINTKIMTSDEIEILIDLIKEKRKKKGIIEWKLLFRGSDDGFLARTFHMKCDDIANTVCVIESNHGNVFGGFTQLPWKSDVGRYHVDEEAFVFIVRKKKRALKKALIYLQYTSSQHSVVHNKYMGPVFGYGHDIYIRNKADKVDDNSCRNHTYQCSYAGELAGKEKFKCINYEVFQISHPEDDDDDDDDQDDDDDDEDDDEDED